MGPVSEQQIRHGKGDDAHWVVTLSGLISGPYHGRYFPALVPETALSAAQGCDAGLYTLGFDFKVENIVSFIIVIMIDEGLVLESTVRFFVSRSIGVLWQSHCV